MMGFPPRGGGAADEVHLSADAGEEAAEQVSAATWPVRSTARAELIATMRSFRAMVKGRS